MSDPKQVLEDRKYTQEHEWAKTEGGHVRIGITAFAVDQLGDITLVNLDVKPGDVIAAGKAFGTIESVKTLSDLFAPIAGKVVEVNAELEAQPELVNDDCWEKGWIILIEPTSTDDAAKLLDAGGYRDHLTHAGH